MSSEYAPGLDVQIAQRYIDEFTGVTNVNFYPDSSHVEGAGVVMAALLQQGETGRFHSFVQDLSPNPEYQLYSLGETLKFCDRDMLKPVFTALDSIDPASLPVEARVCLMASITRALSREQAPDSERPWQNYSIPADDLFEEVTKQPYVDAETISDLMQVAPFTEISDPTSYTGYMAAVVDRFAHSPAGRRIMNTGFGTVRVGEPVAFGALKGLRALGLVDIEQQIFNSLAQDPNYSAVVTTYVEDLLQRDDPAGAALYDTLQLHRGDLAYMQAVDVEHAKYLARKGNVTEALAFAENLPVYRDRVWIMIFAARHLGANGRTVQAIKLMKQAAELDPWAIEPHRPGGEEYVDPYEDMPEVDEENLASMDAFNDEARAREAFVQKSAYDLRQERGVELESIAETAAQLGDFDLAVTAFARSRQYPMQTERSMATTATQQGRIQQYVRAILRCEVLDDISRPGVLEAALRAFHERDDRFDDNGTGQAIEREIQGLARAYAHEQLARPRKDWENSFLFTRIANLLIQCGDYKEATRLVEDRHDYDKSQVTAGIIAHKAYRGITAAATALYMHSPKRPTESLARDGALRAIITNSVLTGDQDSARAAILEVPDYSQQTMLGGVARRVGKQVEHTPAWLLKLALGPDTFKYKSDVKAIAAALRRAELITPRSQVTA